MIGKIIKGIAGFYYVHIVEQGIFECKAKGSFRKDKIKPLVGDYVEIDILDMENKLGNIVDIRTRKNSLIRPAVANVDQAIVIFAATKPKPHFNLLDRFLIMMESKQIPTIICFNKVDLVTEKEMKKLEDVYKNSGYQIIFTSADKRVGIDQLKSVLENKTSVVAGPSGVGKSSLTNLMQESVEMEIGEISHKIHRGKHTTRHSQLINIADSTYLMDTPGFSSLLMDDYEKEDLKFYFPEFSEYEGQCKFQGCSHTHEPGCRVKQAVEEEKISETRYENYSEFYKELSEKRRY